MQNYPGRRVKAAISNQLPDRIPKGELCIEDDLVGQCLNCNQVGFEERAAFIEELGPDLVTLAPDYPVSSTVPETLDTALPDLEKWALKTPLFTFALLDGAFGWGTRTRGYTDFLMLSRSSPLSFQELIDRVEKLNREFIIRLIDRGVDGIIIADDIAYQCGLIINPHTLREFFFPSLARQVKAASGKAPVFFHSDGNYSEIIPELIDCGFQGLQCFERQAGMDPLKLKVQHPELCVWGTLEVEDLQRAKGADYLDKLASEINALSSHKGFILGTTCGLFKGIDLDGLTAIYNRVSGSPEELS
ncbi:uroporphyrinogen decarboxylase family protein [Syntrophaceticus schinkii]|uniref:Uroporphyrinogen-III decarboxylase-like protein n=1 Tax=Syntrophaceticus schinkii TaxID=499207 RepID=A0A0B7MKK2_9FIRM|nr:uroporphyrinogen decarboxylase family protein [Syntrophaceticus schinkii]CEO90580.1 Uroporphyrinogen-III decarboxylase-like protein [Syntrophaceticus schinkii]